MGWAGSDLQCQLECLFTHFYSPLLTFTPVLPSVFASPRRQTPICNTLSSQHYRCFAAYYPLSIPSLSRKSFLRFFNFGREMRKTRSAATHRVRFFLFGCQRSRAQTRSLYITGDVARFCAKRRNTPRQRLKIAEKFFGFL